MYTNITFIDKGAPKFVSQFLTNKFIVFPIEACEEAEVVVSFDIVNVPKLLEYRNKLRVFFLFKRTYGLPLEILKQNIDKLLIMSHREYSTFPNIKIHNKNVELRAKQAAHVIKAALKMGKANEDVGSRLYYTTL